MNIETALQRRLFSRVSRILGIADESRGRDSAKFMRVTRPRDYSRFSVKELELNDDMFASKDPWDDIIDSVKAKMKTQLSGKKLKRTRPGKYDLPTDHAIVSMGYSPKSAASTEMTSTEGFIDDLTSWRAPRVAEYISEVYSKRSPRSLSHEALRASMNNRESQTRDLHPTVSAVLSAAKSPEISKFKFPIIPDTLSDADRVTLAFAIVRKFPQQRDLALKLVRDLVQRNNKDSVGRRLSEVQVEALNCLRKEL